VSRKVDPVPEGHGSAPSDDQVSNSPVRWVAAHIDRYVRSGGKHGHRWSGVKTLLLTTRGRKTGKLRRTALIYGQDGDRHVVVASNGGKPHHPAWYLNLVSNPDVHVQVGTDRFTARARPATEQERPRLWEKMTSIWPEYEKWAKKTTRTIPIVIIESTGEARSGRSGKAT
jgi:deazaflavin-dependent oxidoreductase (nitroreductase family)